MFLGVNTYKEHCAVCHGVPGEPRTAISNGMFPSPPQLFEAADMGTGDPEGETFWKVTNGIRLSGMPGFGGALSDIQRWQVTMLVAHADNFPVPYRPRSAISSECAVGCAEKPGNGY